MIIQKTEIGLTLLHLAVIYLVYHNRHNESGLGLLLGIQGIVCLNFERLDGFADIPANTFFSCIVGPCTFHIVFTVFLLVRLAVHASQTASRLKGNAVNHNDKNR
jgi:hypothetical protein